MGTSREFLNRKDTDQRKRKEEEARVEKPWRNHDRNLKDLCIGASLRLGGSSHRDNLDVLTAHTRMENEVRMRGSDSYCST